MPLPLSIPLEILEEMFARAATSLVSADGLQLATSKVTGRLASQVLTFSLVCRTWRSAANSDALWKRLVEAVYWRRTETFREGSVPIDEHFSHFRARHLGAVDVHRTVRASIHSIIGLWRLKLENHFERRVTRLVVAKKIRDGELRRLKPTEPTTGDVTGNSGLAHADNDVVYRRSSVASIEDHDPDPDALRWTLLERADVLEESLTHPLPFGFRPPCTPDRILCLDRALSARLPLDVVELLLAHDGQMRGVHPLQHPFAEQRWLVSDFTLGRNMAFGVESEDVVRTEYRMLGAAEMVSVARKGTWPDGGEVGFAVPDDDDEALDDGEMDELESEAAPAQPPVDSDNSITTIPEDDALPGDAALPGVSVALHRWIPMFVSRKEWGDAAVKFVHLSGPDAGSVFHLNTDRLRFGSSTVWEPCDLSVAKFLERCADRVRAEVAVMGQGDAGTEGWWPDESRAHMTM